MKTLTKHVMTIAVAGSLLFGGVAVSSAELAKVLSTEREATNTFDDYLDNPLEPDTTSCKHKGKIHRMIAKHSYTVITTISKLDDRSAEMVQFMLSQEENESNPMRWEILKEAWVNKRTIHVKSKEGPCSFMASQPNGNLYWGGEIEWVDVGPMPYE